MSPIFALPYGPLVIFLFRVIDVSLGTVRTLVGVRGCRFLAAAIGFTEVIVWLFAAGSALLHLDSVYHIVAYAGGFAVGNYFGVVVENALALGSVVVGAIIPDETDGTTPGGGKGQWTSRGRRPLRLSRPSRLTLHGHLLRSRSSERRIGAVYSLGTDGPYG